ncbi:hypothetical protein BH20VER2_BH20VER2_15800 [soil metagenome]
MRAGASFLLVLIFAAFTHAQENYRVGITCQKKRLEVERIRGDTKRKVEEKWGYAITIANQSFKDVPDVQVDYIIFYKTAIPGRVENATRDKRSSGTKPVGLLKNNTSFVCETDPIDLTTTQLNANRYYVTGAKAIAKDVITGVKVRVKSGDHVIGEFADPPGLKSSEKWN